jgi:hypothetical protein
MLLRLPWGRGRRGGVGSVEMGCGGDGGFSDAGGVYGARSGGFAA